MHDLLNIVYEILCQEIYFPVYYEFVPEERSFPAVVFEIDTLDFQRCLDRNITQDVQINVSLVGIGRTVDDMLEIAQCLRNLMKLSGKRYNFGILDYLNIENLGFAYDVVENTDEGFYSVSTRMQLNIIWR